MTTWTRSLGLGILLSFALSSSGAVAQESGAGGQIEQSASTSSEDKTAFAKDALTEMGNSEKGARKLLADAEKEGDVLKIQCLNKKLSAVRALVEVTQKAEASMLEALAESNSDRAEHEFRKIAMASSKVQQLRAEADACLGDAGTSSGDTNVEVLNEGLAQGDDTELIEDGNTDIGTDPPGTSPFE